MCAWWGKSESAWFIDLVHACGLYKATAKNVAFVLSLLRSRVGLTSCCIIVKCLCAERFGVKKQQFWMQLLLVPGGRTSLAWSHLYALEYTNGKRAGQHSVLMSCPTPASLSRRKSWFYSNNYLKKHHGSAPKVSRSEDWARQAGLQKPHVEFTGKQLYLQDHGTGGRLFECNVH